MKPVVVRSIPFAIITLLYFSLFELNIVPLPYSSMTYSQRAASIATANELHDPLYPSANTSITSQTPSYPSWVQSLARSTSLATRSIFCLKQGDRPAPNATHIEIQIGGLWRETLSNLLGVELVLPATITRPQPNHAHILPSLGNGYINSRVDLRRRRRAFKPYLEEEVALSSIVLHLREDAMFQPRGVDPSSLADEFKKAALRNRVAEEALAARRLRKARKKKSAKTSKAA